MDALQIPAPLCSAAANNHCRNRSEIVQSYSRCIFEARFSQQKFTGTFSTRRESEESGTRRGNHEPQICGVPATKLPETLLMDQVVAESTPLQEDSDMHARAAQNHPALRRQEEKARTDGFVLAATTSVRSLAGFYGLACPVREQDLSLGEYVARRLGRRRPQVGDGTVWERAELVISELDGRAVRKVRLRILPLQDRRMPLSAAPARTPKRRVQDR
jgi:transporter associated domain-containing protein